MWTCVLHLEMFNVASMQPRSFIDQINLSLRRNHISLVRPMTAYVPMNLGEHLSPSCTRERGRKGEYVHVVCRYIQRQGDLEPDSASRAPTAPHSAHVVHVAPASTPHQRLTHVDLSSTIITIVQQIAASNALTRDSALGITLL